MGKKGIVEQIKNFFSQAKSELSILRDKIGATQAAIEDVENRPINFEAAKSKLRDGIAWNAWRFAEDRFRQVPFMNQDTHCNTLGFSFKEADAFQMMCFFHPELVQEKMETVLQEFLEMNPGVAPGERVQQLAELRDQLMALEVQEEQIIKDAGEVGMKVPRRPDASPEVILNL